MANNDAERAEMRSLEGDDLNDFIAWLDGDAQPYYEPLGRAMVETAELEASLRELLMHRLGRGEAWAVVHALDVSQVLTALGVMAKALDGTDGAELKAIVVDANKLLEPRNALAHGLWLPLFRRGMIVVRHTRNKRDLRGKAVTREDILALADEAAALDVRVRDQIPPPADESAL